MELSDTINRKEPFTRWEIYKLVWNLSVPSILAQLTYIIMEYIDAIMVGSLGVKSAGAIGLVATSTWFLYGLCRACSSGFSVQVAQAVGANDKNKSKNLFRESLIFVIAVSCVFATIGVLISPHLPKWLGGGQELWKEASIYFLIFCLSIPIVQLNDLSSNMLQSTGNMKIPSIFNALICVLNVVFNLFFIFKEINFLGFSFKGCGWGVAGAALGTAVAEFVVCIFLVYFALRSPYLNLKKSWTPSKEDLDNGLKLASNVKFKNGWLNFWLFFNFVNIKSFFTINKEDVKTALGISLPMGLETTVMSIAIIFTTAIIAPLGAVALVANVFAVTAEALCYMPGYGISASATALVGQSLGAKKTELAKQFAWSAVFMGMGVMTLCAVIMYITAPFIFALFTPDLDVQRVGTEILRIEMWAEPLFGASIVGAGALRGAKDTLIPSIFNFAGMWGVRITLSLLWVGKYGIKGVWIAMTIELCVRGILFLYRLKDEKSWLKKYEVKA